MSRRHKNQIDKVLDGACIKHDANQYRLWQAEELLRQNGYVPVPGSDRWCKPEDLPKQGKSPDA